MTYIPVLESSNTGRLLAQDDDNIPAIRAHLRKARGTWARVGQVLQVENVPPRVAAKFCGSGSGRATLRQRNLGPLDGRFGESRGVPHPCSIQDGGEA